MLRSLVRSLPPSVRFALVAGRNLVRHPAATIRGTLEVRADQRRFARANAFLREGPRAEGPRALVVSLSGWPYQLKIEGLLLKALELEGLRPVVLTSRAVRGRAAPYQRAFGFTDVVEIDDYLPRDAAAELEREARALLAGRMSVQRLKQLRYRDVNVGQQVLSTLSRGLYRGSVPLDDPRAHRLLERLLPDSMGMCRGAERVLEAVGPDVVVFNEARYAGNGSIFETALARNLNVIQFVHAFSDDALVFKRYAAATSRVHPRSLGDEAWAEVAAGPWTDAMEAELDAQFEIRYAGRDLLSRRLHEHTRRRARAELVAELGLDHAKPSAVVFSHVLWDANLFYGEDLFEDQEEWLIETIRAAAANPRLNWIVKLHPANVWKRKLEGQMGELPELAAIRAKIGPLPAHVHLLLPDTDVSTRSLFDVADCALTIRGTIGVEAPCFGVPVITAGTGHYSGRGFTVDSDSAASYRALLARLEQVQPLGTEQVLLARKHAHALFCRRPMRFTSFTSVIEPNERLGHPLDHDVLLTLSSRAELERAEDLGVFARWALDRSQEDYLAPLAVGEPAGVTLASRRD